MIAARLRHWGWCCVIGLSAATVAHAGDDECRIAFDVGSSGIRVGASGSAGTARVDIDYLTPLWEGRGLGQIIAPTAAALQGLPLQARLDPACAKMAGGFSAWRLAWSQIPAQTVSALAQIHAASGVALLVIPQTIEGRYGYTAARQKLGDQLQTSHILDIGGGSLQVAGESSSYGQALGQKFWHRILCQQLRPDAPLPCTLQPLDAPALTTARRVLQEKLQDLPAALPAPITMTAISRPVTQGVRMAVQQALALKSGGQNGGLLQRAELSAAIEQLAPLSLADTVQHTGIPAAYAGYVLSDMLLVEGILQATAGQSVHLQEVRVANVPGLLADTQAFAWASRYSCYLQRLQHSGPEAYFSDPHTCEAPPASTSPRPKVVPAMIAAGENPTF